MVPFFSISPLHIPAHILLLYGIAFIVFTLSFCKGDVQLGIAVLGNEQAGGYNGEPFLLGGPLQFAKLLAVEQQLAVALWIMGVPGSPPVLRNMHVLHIQFTPYKIAVAVHQGGLAGPYGFDFGTSEHYSCGVIVQKLILKTGPAVFNLYFAFCFRHNGANVVKKTNFV